MERYCKKEREEEKRGYREILRKSFERWCEKQRELRETLRKREEEEKGFSEIP